MNPPRLASAKGANTAQFFPLFLIRVPQGLKYFLRSLRFPFLCPRTFGGVAPGLFPYLPDLKLTRNQLNATTTTYGV